MDTWIVSMSLLLQMMLQCTWKCRNLFKLVSFVPSDKWHEVELLDHLVVLFLIFWGTSMLFSIMDTPLWIQFIVPQTVHMFSLFSTSSPIFVIFCLFDKSHSNWWCLIVVLICLCLICICGWFPFLCISFLVWCSLACLFLVLVPLLLVSNPKKKKIFTNTGVGSLPVTFFLGGLCAHTVLKEILVLK